jgi:acetoin utilization deacetylase AcuC-like enzyme
MGFCLFNNIAVAAQRALDAHGLERVLILDWDVHHGNGTNDIFHATDRVLFASIHESPLYPGTGPASDVGSGRGRGSR